MIQNVGVWLAVIEMKRTVIVMISILEVRWNVIWVLSYETTTYTMPKMIDESDIQPVLVFAWRHGRPRYNLEGRSWWGVGFRCCCYAV